MFSRSRLRVTAQSLLAALLFAQGALAATVCTMPERSPAQAIAANDVPPCHQAMPEERNPNLCLVDCVSELQSLDKASVVVFALPAVPVLLVEQFLRPDRWRFERVVLTESTRGGAPPPRILFQTFLI